MDLVGRGERDLGGWDLAGVPPGAERRYLELLDAGAAGVPDTPRDPARAALDEALVAAGLATRLQGEIGEDRVVALPAFPVLGGEIKRRELRLAELREQAQWLAERFEERHRPPQYVEVAHGVDATLRLFRLAQLNATSMVRAFDRGPYFTGDPALSDVQSETMARGVEYRVVYPTTGLVDTLANVEEAMAMGEQVKVFADLPMKLTICDDDHALIVLTQSGAHGSATAVDGVLIHRSPLLDAFVALFENIWRLAVPVVPAESTQDVPDSGRILSMLAMDHSDLRIARTLGVSERTVQRRIARLQEVYGVGSRFQLGIQAVRHNLLVE